MRRGCDVVGVDASVEMVKAASLAGVNAHLADGAALAFTGEFDAVFSNATLHWIKPPEAVVAGVWQALRPGGRFVGEFGGAGNVATIIAAIEAALARRSVTADCPWYFPTPVEYAALLESAGFIVAEIELFPRPTALPGDVRGWLETFAQHYLRTVSEQEREGLISEIVDDLRDSAVDGDGNWYADYVRLRFQAERPSAAA
jgi:SAM-dependent methyltransferase